LRKNYKSNFADLTQQIATDTFIGVTGATDPSIQISIDIIIF